MKTERAVKKLMAGRRLFARGESVVAPMGFAVVAVLLIAMTASAVWTFRTQRVSHRAARQAEVRTVSALLWHSAEVMLAANELSAVRRMVAEAARNHCLRRCRIVLPDGQVVADADPARISLQALPPRWADAPAVADSAPADDYAITLSYPLEISARGRARLDVAAGLDHPWWTYWEAEAGLGVIGVVALAMLLFVYRRMRSRLRAMGAIREALLAIESGETTLDASTVSASLGIEANAWNQLLDENRTLRRRIRIEEASESLESRREASRNLSAACDELTQGIVLVDEKGRVRYVNGAATVFLQASREAILDADISQFIHDEDLLETIRTTAAGSTSGRTTVELERREAGGSGVLRFNVRPARRQDPVAAMIIIDDVTQQRVADEARNAFVAQATHELRTPLTNIRLYVESALDEGQRDPALRSRCLTIINQESRRLERMVGDILSVAEIEAGSFKINKDDVHLDAVFAELSADYEAQAKDKQIALRFDLPPKLPVLCGDRDKIVLALHNLVSNALKYTGAGGQVVVSVETDDDQLVVEVRDTGIGIGEDDAPRIFEKFYRAGDSRVAKTQGSGLGLTLAREVIRLHAGNITVRSELNKGSTFTLTLPLVREAEQSEGSRAEAGRGDRSEAVRAPGRG